MATTNGEGQSDPQLRGEELWRHSSPESTAMWKFLQTMNEKHKLQLKNYADLHRWSVDNIATFWEEVWHFVGVKASKQYTKVVDENAPMFPRPAFFEGAELNFAENLLFPAGVKDLDPSSTAIIAATETGREEVSWKDLRQRVEECQRGLEAVGIKKNDRVGGYLGNHINAIVAMLATTSLGAIWTAVSPDSGVQMVVDRMEQIEPRVLFTDDGQMYGGKTFSVLEKVKELLGRLKSLETVVVFNVMGGEVDTLKDSSAKIYKYEDFKNLKSSLKSLYFEQLPADHPIYILYSSGTTGAPKCIVHGAIGTLIQHKKEHVLHCSVTPGSHLFYFTTVTWMMWHWLVSGLAAGATVILYDGSPMKYRNEAGESASDDLAMPKLIDELKINHFGTSAKFLSILEQKNVQPQSSGCTLDSLQAVYNTASPLAPSTFRYVYKAFGPDINLGSITGGTDIVSLFGAACPLLPVYAGEVQGPGLGMAIRAYTEDRKDVTDEGEPGDLVCVKSFPCQPVSFWGPEGHKKYKSSYFETFPGVWHHGDFIEFNPNTGGLIMLGRSDGVLNPAGVRFGSAEIYNVLLKHFKGQVEDGLCVGRRREEDSDEAVILFCKMEKGEEFTDNLANDIKKKVRAELSARHVPYIVDECPDIPVTVNGKKIEGAVKQIISGSKVKTSASVSNSQCLEFYRDWAQKN